MKILSLINKGIEEIGVQEIKEILNVNSSKGNGWMISEIKKFEDLFLLNYLGQSLNRCMLLFNHFEYSSSDHLMSTLKQIVENTELAEWVGDDFVVECLNENKEDFVSQEVAGEVGAWLGKKLGKKVSFKNPSARFFVYITKTHCFFSLDFSGFDLSKREYRIFIGSDTLKGTTAYALLRMGGYTAKKRLLDPFCRSGTVTIEASLFAQKFPVRKYDLDKFAFLKLAKFEDYDFDTYFDTIDEKITTDKVHITALDATFKDVVAAKKNSKIAGVIKSINFSKLNLEWLDTKMGKKSLDLIVTRPIQTGRRINKDIIKKIYKELFYQAEFILEKNGKIVCLMQKKEDIDLLKHFAEQYKFTVSSEKVIMQGSESFIVYIFEKK